MSASPDYVQTSLATALLLRLRAGRLYRDARPRCVNVLLTYPGACAANCAYCGLARSRPLPRADRSFIRVEWPVVATDEIAARLARYAPEVARVCLSMVSRQAAVEHTLAVLGKLHAAVPQVPFSGLIAPHLVGESELAKLRAAGLDRLGIGLDAASERVFEQRRGRGVRGGLDWQRYWDVLGQAARLYGPGHTNCHLVVGLGETDAELLETLFRLHCLRVAAYLFSFYPEGGTQMQSARRPSLVRWRRLQLAKHLIDRDLLSPAHVVYGSEGRLGRLDVAPEVIESAITDGTAFMTHGCPDRHGDLACNRPFGSYRPGEPFRDYPFRPTPADARRIRAQLRWNLTPLALDRPRTGAIYY